MMFVRQRFWHENRHWPSLGRVHWLVAPWATACGRVIEHDEDWLLSALPNRSDMCKPCKRIGEGAE